MGTWTPSSSKRITHPLLLWLKEGSCDKVRSPISLDLLDLDLLEDASSGSFDVRVLDGDVVDCSTPPSDWQLYI